jgi:hypothetical protein
MSWSEQADHEQVRVSVRMLARFHAPNGADEPQNDRSLNSYSTLNLRQILPRA